MTPPKLIIRCTIGGLLGAGLGIAIIVAGFTTQGLGIAIAGGFLGLVLAVSSTLYETTAWETFKRGFLLFLQVTAKKNIPGGEKLVPIKDKNIPGRRRQDADPAHLEHRMGLGIKLGVLVAILPAILIAIYIPAGKDGPDPIVLEVMWRLLIGGGFAAFIGGGSGAVLGTLTLPGVHRRNILLGMLVGAGIGAGLATAISPGAKPPAWLTFCFCCGGFAWVGMLCGLFAGDSLGEPDQEVDDLEDSED